MRRLSAVGRKSESFKCFESRLRYIVKQDTGEIMPQKAILAILKNDLVTITEMVEWVLRDDKTLRDDIAQQMLEAGGKTIPNNTMGRLLGLTIPDTILCKGSTGSSRFLELVNDRVIAEAKSWHERSQVRLGTSTQRVSAGWKRTADWTAPTNLVPKMNLGSVNGQYAKIVNNPFEDGFIELALVIQHEWYILVFGFDPERFRGATRITNPVVRMDENGLVKFNFSAAYPLVKAQYSDEYVIGVDVGRTNYATVVVWSIKEHRIVHSTTLSQRVHSLANSVTASESQRTNLKKKGRDEEARYHREAASRKKRELAILAGQEIAALSVQYGNAVVVFEDLSWVKNTMQNGRWNRGELVKRTTEFVTFNGGWVLRVNSAYTSQLCHQCHARVVFEGWHVAFCP